DFLEKAIRKDFVVQDNKLAKLQRAFVKENLSLYLLLDFLPVWRRLASGKPIENETQLSEVAANLCAPKARMLMVLNNENPSTYLPMTSALVAFFLLENLQQKTELISTVKWSRQKQISKLEGLLKNSWVVLALVKSKRLKFRLALLLYDLKFRIESFKNNKQQTVTMLDAVKIFLYSILSFVMIRTRTTGKERL
ncbi:MAG: hypothetical protein J6039_02065, partial [Alphaproteobacteria bacterium]|nr:hypothetical protein [Alphaproteobacteria bacterium]